MSYFADMTQRAKDTLLSRYRNDDFVQAFATAIGAVAQVVEDGLFDAIVTSRLDSASGEYLDQWGDVVGEPRGGLGREEYQRIIRAKIRSNRSNGLPGDVEKTVEAVYEPEMFRFIRYSPLTLRIVVYPDGSFSDEFVDRTNEIIESSVPAAVQVNIVIADVDQALRYDEPAPNSLDTGLLSNRVL